MKTHSVRAKYVKYSVCDCGFPTLDEDIPFGKLYTAYPDQINTFKMLCGGCGKILSLKFIMVDDGIKPTGWLPLKILEFDEGAD